MRGRKRVFGNEHPETLISQNNLAGAYFELNRFDKAVDLSEETLQIRERVPGAEHPHTRVSRGNLLSAYEVHRRNGSRR
ncbi:tetratricopeptide repeat protein [Dehalococcoides mccartyi]|nr:tetratricopeptide repeat protein [Dehalococcoides mccartyi]